MGATAEELAERVLNTLQEPSLDEDAVLVKFNECAVKVSQRVLLPALETTDDVDTVTTDAFVALPDNFQRNLFHCQDDSVFNRIVILNSKAQMLRYHNDRLSTTGTIVRCVAAAYPNLFYAPIPTGITTLTISYHRNPDTIISTSTFDFLPAGFQDDLPFTYACWKFYETIEQGLEGSKPDSQYYMALYLGLLEELSRTMSEGVSRAPAMRTRMEQW